MKKKLLIALLAISLCVAVPVGVANYNQKTDEKATTNSISTNENETDNLQENDLESDSKSESNDTKDKQDAKSSEENKSDENKSGDADQEADESSTNQYVSGNDSNQDVSEETNKTDVSDEGVVAGMYKEVSKETVDYNTVDTNASKLIVNETLSDQYVVPDKYSTGAKGTLTAVTKATVCNGVPILVSGNIGLFNPKFVDIPDNVTISGYDFSSFKEFTALSYKKYTTNKTVTFENCKFSRFRTALVQDKMKFIFKNCTFANFYGSNATLTNCYLGGVMRDTTNPFQNVTYDSCMFADICHPLESGVLHSDGCQIYANKDAPAINIHFKNCRFEMPRFRFSNTESQNTVNTCIGLMLEYNNGDDISWERCVVNGGGYSIYLSCKHGCTFTNASLKDIRVGCSHEYGTLYKNSTGGAEYVNVRDTDSLYIGSVWKDEKNKTHMSVTNDTNVKRELTVYTNKGWRKYNVDACKTCNELTIDKYTYKDMPFDIDITIPEDIDFLVCYDTTSDITKQIRFVNMGDSEVSVCNYEKYLSKVISEE